MARFDWYQATIPAPLNDVLEALDGLQDGPQPLQMRHSRGMHGFAHETSLSGSDGVLAKVWHGGCHEYPHVVLSGESSQPGAELIRTHFPQHKVSRADACEDFTDQVFDRIQAAMLEAAQSHRVKVDTRGDHLLTKQGRTVYLGAHKSACRMRLYDKAAELRAKFAKQPQRLADVPEHLVRLEAQVRPAGDRNRSAFARVEPVYLMACSAWQREVWRLVTGMELSPVQVHKPWRQADDDRAWAYMLAQYGPTLARMRGLLGSWECVGLQIAQDLQDRADAKRMGRPG